MGPLLLGRMLNLNDTQAGVLNMVFKIADDQGLLLVTGTGAKDEKPGLELALHTTYRTVSRSAGSLGLPEVSLGLVPGWGGTFLLPNLIGIDKALDVVLWNPLRQNRSLTPQQAFELGLRAGDATLGRTPRRATLALLAILFERVALLRGLRTRWL